MENKEKRANMPTYTVEHPSWAGCVAVAEYELPWVNEEGVRLAQLRSVTFNDRSHFNFIKPMLLRLPTYVIPTGYGIPRQFEMLTEERCVVKNITTSDLSFVRFWNSYGYKVGNKATVEKKWNALKEEDRLLALAGIAKQRRHSESHKTDMPYPETYINQRRWENEF